jgi:hypothetical protein
MKLRQIALSAFLASSLVASPVAAHAAPVEGSRSASSVEGEQLNKKVGWGIAVAVVIAVIAILLSDNDEKIPVSP